MEAPRSEAGQSAQLRLLQGSEENCGEAGDDRQVEEISAAASLGWPISFHLRRLPGQNSRRSVGINYGTGWFRRFRGQASELRTGFHRLRFPACTRICRAERIVHA